MGVYIVLLLCLLYAGFCKGAVAKGCKENLGETPSLNMCQIGSISGAPNETLYLDSSGAPIRARVECNCTLTFTGTGSIQVHYRVTDNQLQPNCGAEFHIDDDEWSCETKYFTATGSQAINNVTYRKTFNDRDNWYACLGIKSVQYGLTVVCYPHRNYYAPGEVVDGNFGSWSEWSACSQTCGAGNQSRTRQCDSPSPRNGGEPCVTTSGMDTNTTETVFRTCTVTECPDPIDGGFTNWSEWTACSLSCGGGSRDRTRTCTNPEPQHAGAQCTGDTRETGDCNTDACPGPGFTAWSEWTECSVSCGGGRKERNRTCTNPESQNTGAQCIMSETGDCNIHACPVHGAWSEWSAWGNCSKYCGGGYSTRSRTCTDPKPKDNGMECIGDSIDIQTCGEANCPINGGWGNWSRWSHCSYTCGYGDQTRYRLCDSPLPQYDGEGCVGNETEDNVCYLGECPVDGSWGQWSSLSSCSVSCKTGIWTRKRECDSPSPQNEGLECDGINTETEVCTMTDCPIHGNWGPWSPWSICEITCGSGTISRSRNCDNPKPNNGGNMCSGNPSEDQTCLKESPCSVDGGTGPWSPWNKCDRSCGTGERSRTRFCNNPPPQNNGRMCSDSMTEVDSCNEHTCPATSTSAGGPNTQASVDVAEASSSLVAIIVGVIGSLLVLLLIILLILCLVRRRRRNKGDDKRRPSTGPRSVRYISHGDDVTVTENELYHYDGETPSHATNALFVGGIPDTPSSPGYIPHFSTDTGERYAVIVDSNRSKPKSKERPSLDSVRLASDNADTETANENGNIRASTDTVKLSESYSDDRLGGGLENPGYDGTYLAPYDTPDADKKPKTSQSSSPSPYDYIDHEKLKKDEDFDNLGGDYATLPEDLKVEKETNSDRYKRLISSEPEGSPDDGYLKSPKRDQTFQFPNTN